MCGYLAFETYFFLLKEGILESIVSFTGTILVKYFPTMFLRMLLYAKIVSAVAIAQ